MRRPQPTVRLRLTALYAGLLVASVVLLLGVSWSLLADHLHRTLPAFYADDVLDRLRGQYAVAVIGTALLAIALGWALAGRVLAPIRRITATARRVSDSRLDERIGLDGPRDELRDLAETLDAMLERLQSAVDSQRRFVANASHELRSPLTVIRTETEVTLADDHASVADLRRMGEVVLEATDRTEALLDGLLVLALSQRGLQRRERVDLATLARRAAAAVAAEAVERRVRVGVDAAPVTVEGDPQLLERLAANLAENAVRHNEHGGFVEIAVRPHDAGAVLHVVNSGEHIPPEALTRLAEPFQRLDRCSDGRGSGLGLSIVRSVAEAHAGSLELRSREAGGLDVTVTLPAVSAGRAESGARHAPRPAPVESAR